MSSRARHAIGWFLAILIATIGLVGMLVATIIVVETSGTNQVFAGGAIVGSIAVAALGPRLEDKLTGGSGTLENQSPSSSASASTVPPSVDSRPSRSSGATPGNVVVLRFARRSSIAIATIVMSSPCACSLT